jgi:hypothetical protein
LEQKNKGALRHFDSESMRKCGSVAVEQQDSVKGSKAEE